MPKPKPTYTAAKGRASDYVKHGSPGFEPQGFLHGEPGWELYTEKEVRDLQKIMAGIAIGMGYDNTDYDNMLWEDDIDQVRVVFEALAVRFPVESRLFRSQESNQVEVPTPPEVIDGVTVGLKKEEVAEAPELDLTKQRFCSVKDHRVCNLCKQCTCTRKKTDDGRKFLVTADKKGNILCPACRTEVKEKEKANAS
jgi:hypothetical protein